MKKICLQNNILMSVYMKRKIICIFLIGWLTLIFCLSHEPSSVTTHTTHTFSKTIFSSINFCIGNVFSKEEIEDISVSLFVFMRKGAHVFLYFILTILLFLFFHTFSFKEDLFLISFLFAIFYACTDEIHQLFIEGREGQIFDVFIDSIGILFGILLCYLFFLHKKKQG